jgi:hypothetical protein
MGKWRVRVWGGYFIKSPGKEYGEETYTDLGRFSERLRNLSESLRKGTIRKFTVKFIKEN